MAELYRQTVTTPAQALKRSAIRTKPAEALRGLIDAIVLASDEGALRIELKGNLAATLSAATPPSRARNRFNARFGESRRSLQRRRKCEEVVGTGDLSLQIEMVAGARNRRYLQLWSGAA
jgi:hypothetical protein